MINQNVVIALAAAVERIEAQQDGELDLDQICTIVGICEVLDINTSDVLDAKALGLVGEGVWGV